MRQKLYLAPQKGVEITDHDNYGGTCKSSFFP